MRRSAIQEPPPEINWTQTFFSFFSFGKHFFFLSRLETFPGEEKDRYLCNAQTFKPLAAPTPSRLVAS